MESDNRSVLVLLAHPSIERSETNTALFEAAQQATGVTAVDLYAEYPNYRIDIDREQRRLREHDAICFLFPLYWYSTPALLKEWQDLVLEYGFAYGKDGTALEGKLFFCALSAGGEEKAYREGGAHHYTIGELLQPLEQTAALCGMHYLPPFALFEARSAVREGRLESHVAAWRALLASLVEGRFDPAEAAGARLLNEVVDDAEATS